MNKNFSKIAILIAMSFWGNHLIAGTVTVPNTFTGGTTASASEVNANFDAIKTAVDDNDSRITTNASDIGANASNIAANTNAISSIGGIGVFVDGVRVVLLLGYPTYLSTPIAILLQSNYLAIISPLGEGLYPSRYSGLPIHEILYQSNDCTDQAYVDGASVEAFVSFGQGQLYAIQGLSTLTYYYIPAGTPAESLTYNSKDAGSGCIAVSASVEVYKTFLNDPNVTGVTGAELIGSVTIGN